MKYLILAVGLICYIVGLFLMKDDEQKKKSAWLILAGGLLIIANCFYLWYTVYNKIELGSILVALSLAVALIVYTILYSKESLDSLKWGIGSFVLVGMTLVITFGGKLPPVTLEDGVIKMGGSFGRTFNISDIRTVDTASVYPKTGARRNGAGLPSSSIGDYALVNERMTAKLCLYRNNPPYIIIRMNDNSLFILNFKEPDRTVEFYNQIKEKV